MNNLRLIILLYFLIGLGIGEASFLLDMWYMKNFYKKVQRTNLPDTIKPASSNLFKSEFEVDDVYAKVLKEFKSDSWDAVYENMKPICEDLLRSITFSSSEGDFENEVTEKRVKYADKGSKRSHQAQLKSNVLKGIPCFIRQDTFRINVFIMQGPPVPDKNDGSSYYFLARDIEDGGDEAEVLDIFVYKKKDNGAGPEEGTKGFFTVFPDIRYTFFTETTLIERMRFFIDNYCCWVGDQWVGWKITMEKNNDYSGKRLLGSDKTPMKLVVTVPKPSLLSRAAVALKIGS